MAVLHAPICIISPIRPPTPQHREPANHARTTRPPRRLDPRPHRPLPRHAVPQGQRPPRRRRHRPVARDRLLPPPARSAVRPRLGRCHAAGAGGRRPHPGRSRAGRRGGGGLVPRRAGRHPAAATTTACCSPTSPGWTGWHWTRLPAPMPPGSTSWSPASPARSRPRPLRPPMTTSRPTAPASPTVPPNRKPTGRRRRKPAASARTSGSVNGARQPSGSSRPARTRAQHGTAGPTMPAPMWMRCSPPRHPVREVVKTPPPPRRKLRPVLCQTCQLRPRQPSFLVLRSPTIRMPAMAPCPSPPTVRNAAVAVASPGPPCLTPGLAATSTPRYSAAYDHSRRPARPCSCHDRVAPRPAPPP